MAHLPRTMTAANAKTHFADCLRAAEAGAPTLITRHGRPVAALVSADDLKTDQRVRAGGPMEGLAGRTGAWEGSDDLVESIMKVVGERRLHSRRSR